MFEAHIRFSGAYVHLTSACVRGVVWGQERSAGGAVCVRGSGLVAARAVEGSGELPSGPLTLPLWAQDECARVSLRLD